MSNTLILQKKEELLQLIEVETNHISTIVKDLGKDKFLENPGEKWSIAENLEHLIISNLSVTKAFSIPKEKLADKFGRKQEPARAWSEMEVAYLDGIKNGAKAPPQFSPQGMTEKPKEEILEIWKGIPSKMEMAVNQWSEEELDQYQIPHPILGNLSMRELLYFTKFHTNHHLKAIQRIL